MASLCCANNMAAEDEVVVVVGGKKAPVAAASSCAFLIEVGQIGSRHKGSRHGGDVADEEVDVACAGGGIKPAAAAKNGFIN